MDKKTKEDIKRIIEDTIKWHNKNIDLFRRIGRDSDYALEGPEDYINEDTLKIKAVTIKDISPVDERDDLFIADTIVLVEHETEDREEDKRWYVNINEGCADPRGYAPFLDCDTELFRIERIDAIDLFGDDNEAVIQAQKDGFKLIPREEIPSFSGKWLGYLDTPKNRMLLDKYAKREADTGCDFIDG